MREYVGFSRTNTALFRLLGWSEGEGDRWIEWRTLVDDLAAGSRKKVRGMPSEWRVVLHRLRQRKLIEEERRGRRLMVRLTKPAKSSALIKSIRSEKDYYPVGQGCVVVYDVPETERAARNLFRRFLEECGFRQLQRSVWVSRKNVAAIVSHFVKQNKLTPWIIVIDGTVRT